MSYITLIIDSVFFYKYYFMVKKIIDNSHADCMEVAFVHQSLLIT